MTNEDLKPSHEQLLKALMDDSLLLWQRYDDTSEGWINVQVEGDVLSLSFEPDEDRTVPTGDVSVVHRFRLVPLADESGDES